MAIMEVSTLLVLLISSALSVSSSPQAANATLSWSADCHQEDISCSNHSRSWNGGPDDPVTGFWLLDPKDGAVTTVPIEMRLAINVTRNAVFEDYYADAYLCVELNGLWKKCKTPGGPPIIFRLLPEGNYTATAYMTDRLGRDRYHEMEAVTFTVLSSSDYRFHNAQLGEKSREEQKLPVDVDLVHWAEVEMRENTDERKDDNLVLPRTHVLSTSSPMLVIGVKSAVVTSFPRRQAIRDTWANPATLPHDVKVLFLGCEPNMTDFENDHDRERVLRAVEKERAVYRDLLTEELECIDSYQNLSDKVKLFLHLAAAEFPRAKFVMLADDDIYVKVGQLAQHLRTANRPKLYFGEVWAETFANRQKPIRNSDSPYHLPEDQYPMEVLLPYASGPHYVVSMDSVRFIAKNTWHLRSMNGLEDVSSGFWLRSIGVQARHSAEFSSIRASMTCDDSLVSFADLSPLGIRSIHANMENGRNFCHGFDGAVWLRHLNAIPNVSTTLHRSAPSTIPALQFELFLGTSQLAVLVSSPSRAGTKLPSLPSESVADFHRRLCSYVQHLHSSPCPSLSSLQLVVDQLPLAPYTSMPLS